MQKQELRSICKNLLPKYEEIVRFHDNVIDRGIEKALAEFYNLVFLRSPHELERYTKQFYSIGIVLEAATGLYYADYPLMADGITNVTTIAVPDKASGVRRISTNLQGGITFLPIDAREMDLLMAGSYVDTISMRIGYCPRRTRVEFYNISAATTCRMDLLIPFSKYEETDTVLVPELVNDQGQGFLDRVLQLLSNVKPVELNENKSLEEGK
jgi:hypothetical protein